MGRRIPTPFKLSVHDELAVATITIDTIIRVVPGKRIVALSNWKHQSVVIKLFFRSGSWKQNLLRDLGGVNLLRQANIATPKIIGQTTTVDKHGALLILEYLKQGVSLLTLFDEAKNDVDKRRVVEMGIEAIARCHRAGLWQKDIHLDNFMLCKEKVYVLDGGEIKGDGRELQTEVRIDNLSMFFAQFPITLDGDFNEWLSYYQKFAAALPPNSNERLASKIVAARQKRLKNYEKKLFRSSTANRAVQFSNRFAVYDRAIHSEELEAMIRRPDKLMSTAKMLKEGNSSTVAIVKIGGRELVLKRYNIKSFSHGLARLLQPSRAHHSWRNAAVLEMLGIATPHPFMVIEERFLWVFRRRAWYLSEFIDAKHLLQQVEEPADQSLPMQPILEQFDQLFRAMRTYNISHGDMKASNFIYSKGRLYVLDLDAMRRFKSGSKIGARLQKDTDRFRQNWVGTRFEDLVQQFLDQLGPMVTP